MVICNKTFILDPHHQIGHSSLHCADDATRQHSRIMESSQTCREAYWHYLHVLHCVVMGHSHQATLRLWTCKVKRCVQRLTHTIQIIYRIPSLIVIPARSTFSVTPLALPPPSSIFPALLSRHTLQDQEQLIHQSFNHKSRSDAINEINIAPSTWSFVPRNHTSVHAACHCRRLFYTLETAWCWEISLVTIVAAEGV